MKPFSDKKIVDSWRKNASPWIQAIQQSEIESRTLVTNSAIIDAVLSCSPKTVLDIGCGEGWLVRALSDYGVSGSGIDVVPELIIEAQKQSTHNYSVLAYEEINLQTVPDKYDLVVCNFSLLGKESVEHIVNTVPGLLNAGGSFIVQTVDPEQHGENKSEPFEYRDGWREGSWKGFNNQFSDPAPWYFRTTESWLNLFKKYDYELDPLEAQIKPLNPNTGKPASLILIAKTNFKNYKT